MKPKDQRGFLLYEQFTDTYGADVMVKQSSSAEGPRVWIFVKGGGIDHNNGAAHLDIEMAKKVRDAIDAWLKDHAEGK